MLTSLRFGVVGRVEPNTENYVRCRGAVCVLTQAISLALRRRVETRA